MDDIFKYIHGKHEFTMNAGDIMVIDSCGSKSL
jgi:hypothetical protein